MSTQRHEKSQIRHSMRNVIANLSDHEHKALSAAIRGNLAHCPLWNTTTTIIGFCPTRSEPDILPLLIQGMHTGKTIGLVRISDDTATRSLNVHLWDGNEASLIKHPQLPLREPASRLPIFDLLDWKSANIEMKNDATCTIALIPGVAFTRQGDRLGHGAGYYDQWLSNHPGIIKIGICFGLQIVDQIPIDIWDQRMNYILTETGLHPVIET